jgi:hypothetical protein
MNTSLLSVIGRSGNSNFSFRVHNKKHGFRPFAEIEHYCSITYKGGASRWSGGGGEHKMLNQKEEFF